MIDIAQFYNLKELNEKNQWFRDVITKIDLPKVPDTEIWGLIEMCFPLFEHNFKNNNYAQFEFVSDACEELLNRYLTNHIWIKIANDDRKVDLIIDIVCFVYELTHKYAEKAEILKKIIKTTGVTNKLKVRALTNILEMTSWSTVLTENEIQQYSLLLHACQEEHLS